MNLPMSWLKDYMNIDLSKIETREFEHKMTMSGSKVEGTSNRRGEMKNILIGKILEVEKHPDADKLVVCQVNVGESENIQIVTAATNVFPGAVVPVAMHKSVIHGGTQITRGKLRGVGSNGMFCSTDELGLTPEGTATGIMLLPEDAPLGADVCEYLGLDENVVEFEITSNRPDCLSIIGLARETAATYGLDFNIPDPAKYPEIAEKAEDNVTVEVKDFELCPRYLAKVVKNVKIGPSPEWMQKRLEACGLRAINNIVDITNYVMLEYGQPMHAYDLDNVADHKIIVRRGGNGELLETLDDQPHELNDTLITIADGQKAIGVAGIMGGANSEVTEGTTTVLFEAATFKGSVIRRGAKQLGMRTDASALFEKGLDVYNLDGAINRACQLIAEMGAGEVLSGTVEVKGELKKQFELPFEPAKMNKFLGTEIPEADMIKYLEKLEFEVKGGIVKVPTFRADIIGMADIAEEVARFYGYDIIPSTLMQGGVVAGGKNEMQKFEDKLKRTLCASGMSEISTYSFIDPQEYKMLRIPEGDKRYDFVKILNPLGEENSVMRTTMISSMLEVLKTNYNKRNESVALYETGKIYIKKEGEQLPDENLTLSLGMYGNGDFYVLKGIIENLFEIIGISRAKFVPEKENVTFHPGRCAKILLGDKVLGVMGQIHPGVASTYKIGTDVYVAELDCEVLFENAMVDKHYKHLPKFPATTRDIAMVLDEGINVGEIDDIIEKHKKHIVESYKLFDVYRGAQLGDNKKSVAYSLVFRAADRTLTDDEVNEVMQEILEELKQKLGADLR